jgi:arsenate reductase
LNKIKVLFLCTGNSARSQMAEAILRQHGGDRFEAFSAGLDPKPINPLTMKVMAETGYDMSAQTSKMLTQFMGKAHFGYLITVCSQAEDRCPIFPGMGVRLHWPFEDPAAFQGTDEEKLAKFREICDLIDTKIRSWLLEKETPVSK